MAQPARYDYDYRATAVAYGSNAPSYQVERAPEQQPRERYRVIPGQNRGAERAAKLSLSSVRSFKAIIAVVVILALVCGIRVFMSVATVQAMEASQSLQTQIEEARAVGNDLEIRHSVLANPSAVQKKATKLGMHAPKTTERLVVALPAKTATNANGAISISGTIKSIENSRLGSK